MSVFVNDVTDVQCLSDVTQCLSMMLLMCQCLSVILLMCSVCR